MTTNMTTSHAGNPVILTNLTAGHERKHDQHEKPNKQITNPTNLRQNHRTYVWLTANYFYFGGIK